MSNELMKSRGYNLRDRGYAFAHIVEEKPWEDINELKKNRTPRTFPISCPLTKCIWNRKYESNDMEHDSCSREEAWNVLDVEELEMVDDNLKCPWYSGMTRRATLASIQSRTAH